MLPTPTTALPADSAADPLETVVAAVEGHSFDPVAACEWRSSALDFQNLDALIRSLAAPPPRGARS